MVLPITALPLLKKESVKKLEKSRAQLNCEAKGGRWDESTKTCILPEPKKKEVSKVPVFTPPKTGIELGDIQGTAKQSVVLPDGRQLFGLNTDDVAALKGQQARREARLEGTAPIGTAQAQAEIAKEQARLTAEEQPVRRELDPNITGLERIPVIGGVIGTLGDTFVRPIYKKLGIKTTKGLHPEELRNAALTEIERQEIERGLTYSESFGRIVESIGLSKVDLFGLSAKDLIETPSENAKEVKSNILKEKRRISNIETNVRYGYLPVSVAQEQIGDIEENIQRLESRIRLLIYKSPELRFNSDFVNTIETEILATREKLFQAKLNVLQGKKAEPTDLQLLQQMQLEDEE